MPIEKHRFVRYWRVFDNLRAVLGFYHGGVVVPYVA